jgi:hypothetical protein
MNFFQAVSAAITPTGGAGGIVTTGLVFHIDPTDTASYPGSGNTIFDLAGANNGTFEGGVYVDASGHLRLDGVNDAINFGTITTSNVLSFQATSFSINYWMYAVNSGELFQHAFSQWASDGRRLQATIYPIGRQLFTRIDHFTTSDFSQVGTVTNVYSSSVWYYYSAVIDIATSTMRHYLNGIEVGTATLLNAVPATVRSMRIGARGSNLGNNEWNGRLGSYHVYNTALTPSEILQNFNATKAGYGL